MYYVEAGGKIYGPFDSEDAALELVRPIISYSFVDYARIMDEDRNVVREFAAEELVEFSGISGKKQTAKKSHGKAAKPKRVDIGPNFYRVRFREPEEFVKIRTPDWAAHAASSIVKGAEVRTGQKKDGRWYIQNVMIPVKGYGIDRAIQKAEQIQNMIEERR